MGYTTDFYGKLKFNKQLSLDDKTFLDKFARTRRVARNVDPKYGVEGEFYVDAEGDFGQDFGSANIIDYNRPPKTQPSLWCQWVPTEDGWYLEWDGSEKFYNYIDWLEYLITKIFTPRGYILNGEIEWRGEDHGDNGTIRVTNNFLSSELKGDRPIDTGGDEYSGWWSIKFDGPEPSDSTKERIGKMVAEGYTSGDYSEEEG